MKKQKNSILNKHEKGEWDTYYKKERESEIKPKNGFFASYDISLCDYFVKKYIPSYKGSSKNQPTITEIGSGDGKLLKKFARMLGYKPLGIEYSKEAVKMAKQNGVRTIVGDAFDTKLLQKYKNYFDLVYSYGFVEHIIPPEKAVKIHLDMLKPGGYFIIQIPRFVGFNLWKMKFFRPDLIKAHNLKIMESSILNTLCNLPNVQKIYCGNYGTLKLRFSFLGKNYKYYLLQAMAACDYIMNPLLRFLFGTRGFETHYFSPAVMFIGRKIK